MTEIENQIADRREFFNDSVSLYNIAFGRFPAVILAFIVGYRENAFLKARINGALTWK